MDFPSYIPEGARRHARHFLNHFETELAESKKRLSEIEEDINYWLHPDQDADIAEDRLIELRQRKAEETKHRDDLEHDIESIKRLIQDARMKDAYQILTNAFFDDEDSERQRKFDGFIYAAWAARLDFLPYRERLKQAAELRDEIAKAAENLAGLLDRIDETGVMYPSEFFCIPDLLRNTDNHEMDDCNLRMWQTMRGHVLGDPPQREASESEQTEIYPAEQTRNTLRYAWRKAPPLSALLKTVSKAAKEFKPSESGMIGAAIDSRKKNLKAEYLRAFGNLLTEEHRFILNKDIMKAMVVAANVVIDSPDIDVTYDDVRKALAK